MSTETLEITLQYLGLALIRIVSLLSSQSIERITCCICIHNNWLCNLETKWKHSRFHHLFTNKSYKFVIRSPQGTLYILVPHSVAIVSKVEPPTSAILILQGTGKNRDANTSDGMIHLIILRHTLILLYWYFALFRNPDFSYQSEHCCQWWQKIAAFMGDQSLCTALDQNFPYNDINFTYRKPSQQLLLARRLTADCTLTAATCMSWAVDADQW